MTATIHTPAAFRETPVVAPTTPRGWEPPHQDDFDPEAVAQALREEHDNLRFVLFSGGYDSLVAAHYVMEELGKGDVVLHANTLTAIPENTQFVREVCQAYHWPLITIDSPKTLEDFVLSTRDGDPYGFPGAGAHSVAFRWFKERAFRQAAKANPARKPDLYTGVRKHESEKRMRTVKAEVQHTDRFIWKAPLWQMRDQWMADYIQENDLPRSIVVEILDRSGDCFCGSYADRISELERLQNPWDHLTHDRMVRIRSMFGSPRLAQFEDALGEFHGWLMAVEERVQQEIGTDQGYCWWGHPADSSKTLRELKAEQDDSQVMLCETCGPERWETISMDEYEP